MLFCFIERHQLNLLREFAKNKINNKNYLIKKYMAIEIWSYLGSKLSNKVHEHTYQIRCFWCQNMVKFLYIFILYIVVIKIAAAIFFRQNCNMIISVSYKKKSSNVFWKKKRRNKQTLFHKLVKYLNFASKKYNLRKAEGLKLYSNGIFFFFKKSTAIKKILQSLRCGGHHQK